MTPIDIDCEQIETVDMDLADSDDPYYVEGGAVNIGRPPNLDPVDLLRFLCNFKSLPPEAVLQLRIVIEKYLPNVANKELREKFTLLLQHLSNFHRPKLTEHGSGQAHTSSQFLMPSLPQATDNSGRSWLFPREYLAPLMDALGIKWKCLRDRPELELTEHPGISVIENDDDDDDNCAQSLPMGNGIENHTEHWLWGNSCSDAREQFIPLKRRRLATDVHPQTRNESDGNEFVKRRRLETNGNYVNHEPGNESDDKEFTDSMMETESLEDENTNPWPNTQHTVGDGFHFQPCSVTTDTFGSHPYPSSYEPPNKRIKVSSW